MRRLDKSLYDELADAARGVSATADGDAIRNVVDVVWMLLDVLMDMQKAFAPEDETDPETDDEMAFETEDEER